MITVQTETLDQSWDDILPLACAYWKEAESVRHYQGLNMSRARYAEYEDAGMLHCVTARDSGVLVGYAIGYISDSMRSQLKTWTDDMFYVQPEYRGHSVATALVRYVEDWCLEHGVVEIFLHGRADSAVPEMLEHVDYQLVSVQYSKRLSRADSASDQLAVMETTSNEQRLRSQAT